MIARKCLAKALILALPFLVSSQAHAQGTPDSRSTVRLPAPNEWEVLAPERGSRNSFSSDVARLVRRIQSKGEPEKAVWETEAALFERLGIRRGDPNPIVTLHLTLEPGKLAATDAELKSVGLVILSRQANRVVVAVPLRRIPLLGEIGGIRRIEPGARTSPPPAPVTVNPQVKPPSRGSNPTNPLTFDRKGLTGKGVIVGIIDSGIYWKHPDFIKPDGTSRILALWDPYDDSYNESKGKIGSPAPVQLLGKSLGTLYTQAQLTAAIKGKGTVNSGDDIGHGTACTSTAAGNGRATGGVSGVAPEADIIVVNISIPDEEGKRDGGLNGDYGNQGARWAMGLARKAGKPIVLNMSYGSHRTAHDGNSLEEKEIDSLIQESKTGLAVCIAAGNEGHRSIAATGTFGPLRAGQRDTVGAPIELILNQSGLFHAFFNASDDWGVSIKALSGALFGTDEQPVEILIRYQRASQKMQFSVRGKPRFSPEELREILENVVEVTPAVDGNPARERLRVTLPEGRFIIQGLGTSPTVSVGRFFAYLPISGTGHFGYGATEQFTVGAPGTASRAITVGSYDLLSSWTASSGRVQYLLAPGELSSFSSVGPSRSGAVKPDLVAPGRYLISSLAPGSQMASRAIAQDERIVGGQHLAWAGTSAASPYTAGVVALMFEKNPALSAQQVHEILKKSAKRDQFTMGVPNPQWGYGKLDPVAAIQATPSGPARRGRK